VIYHTDLYQSKKGGSLTVTELKQLANKILQQKRSRKDIKQWDIRKEISVTTKPSGITHRYDLRNSVGSVITYKLLLVTCSLGLVSLSIFLCRCMKENF